MIERYVFLKLKDEYATDDGRIEVAKKTQQVLGAMDMVEAVVVGIPADEASTAAWDLSARLQFASNEDLEKYVDDPAHKSYVEEFLAPRTEVVKAWNFEPDSGK